MQLPFTIDGPDQLWVVDITRRRNLAGWAYAVFVIEVHTLRYVS